MPTAAQNTIVSIAEKVKDNVLYVITALVIAPKSAAQQNPAANLLHTLLRVPNAFIIKWVRMPMGKLKLVKLRHEPAEAQI